ncbi:MAG: type I DNA topoisomerase [Firmicutes bacterium]|nr:type I DNA topoisomerase [Bacillota bacterium]
MPKPLIIVESPAKARTISRFLGKRYQVLPSMGHVRDLPKSQFGVDVEHGFQPKYITIRGKGQVVRELREAAKKSEQVYLATDPDREGEAISWHLAEVLGLSDKQVKRIEFHEITKDAVARAIKHWRPLSYGLVDAQQARRILDRIVGYQLSPWLWRKVRPGLSAGRVQSTALRLLVERQAEIDAFVPEEYFTLTASLSGGGTALSADYLSPLGERGRLSRTELDTVVAEVGPDVVPRPPFRIADVKERERRRYAPFAFTTSTLQQEASKRLGLTVKRAMQLAQQLYEGLEVQGEGTVGLITYIRTDSTRVAESAEEEGRQYIREVYGLEYESRERRRAPSRPGQQGAHEAIRPTVVRRTPDSLKRSLSRDQLRLYRLIWERFVASQMAPAVYDTVTVDVAAGRHTFRSRMQKLKFPGFTALYDEPDEDAATGQPLTVPLRVGEALNVEDLKSEQHFTEPPPRYTEASLVKALEDLGIGRPSTYAPTIETLLARDYARREERRLVPTELGRAVVDLLKEFFPRIVDIQFTAAMEADLDRVEEGQESWRALLQSFYDDFSGYLVRAEKEAGPVHIAEEATDEVCDRCGRPMVIKHGRFGRFLACSGYPECQNTRPLLQKTGAECPKCARPVVVRRSRKGRTFYGCSGYPECDFVTWYPPSDKMCPRCGAFLAQKGRGPRGALTCVREGCGYEERVAQ